jgi:hypothetical protein
MPDDCLAHMENDLRTAAVQRRYIEVERLARLYCSAAEAHARSLPPGDPGTRRIARRVAETLERSRLILCVARAAAADELSRLPLLNRYISSSGPPKALLRLDA